MTGEKGETQASAEAFEPFTYKWKEAKLEAAFRKLKIWQPNEDSAFEAIPYGHTLPGLIRGLILLADKNWQPVPHMSAASTGQTSRELATLVKHAAKLLSALEALHAPAIAALPYKAGWPRGVGELSSQLRMLVTAASNAEVPKTDGPKPGRRRSDRAAKVAEYVAVEFWRLTGNRPGRIVTVDTATQEAGKETGPFLTLLTEVFGALNIKADPVRQAREAIAAMDKITDKQ